MLYFFVGLIIGGLIGVAMMACCAAAGRADKWTENKETEE